MVADVLAQKPYSDFVSYFDIRPTVSESWKVDICNLAHPYGEVLTAGALARVSIGGEFKIKHFDNVWPLCAASWGEVLTAVGLPHHRPDPCFAKVQALQHLTEPTPPGRKS